MSAALILKPRHLQPKHAQTLYSLPKPQALASFTTHSNPSTNPYALRQDSNQQGDFGRATQPEALTSFLSERRLLRP